MTTQAKTPIKRTPKAAQAAAVTPEPTAVTETAPVAETPAAAPAEVAAPVVAETPAPKPAEVAAPAKAAAAKPTAAKPTPVAAPFGAFEFPKFEFPKFDLPGFDASRFELPKFDVPSLAQPEIPEVLRQFAEKAVSQARTNYDKLKVAAEEATDAIEDTYEAARSGIIAFNSKTIDAAKANSDATLGHAKDLLSVKTFAQAIEMQTAFLRHQYEALSAQAKELQELATKVAGDAAKPAREVLDKTLDVLKKD